MVAVLSESLVNDPEVNSNYWQFFELHRDPFPPGKEIHLEALPQWQESLDLLQTIVTQTNKLAAVVAKDDSESSAILHFFRAQHEETYATYMLEAHLRLTATEFATKLAQQFSLDVNDVAVNSPLQNIPAFIAAFEQYSFPVVVMIPRAQLLPADTLLFIQQLMMQQNPAKAAVHVILAGINALLDDLYHDLPPALREQRLQILAQRPLSPAQTEHYINYSLQAAGLLSVTPFSRREIQYIQKFSMGDLTQLKRAARRMLIAKAAGKPAQADPVVSRSIGLCALIILLSTLTLAVYGLRESVTDVSTRFMLAALPISQLYSHDLKDFTSNEAAPSVPVDDFSNDAQQVEIPNSAAVVNAVKIPVKKAQMVKPAPMPIAASTPPAKNSGVTQSAESAKPAPQFTRIVTESLQHRSVVVVPAVTQAAAKPAQVVHAASADEDMQELATALGPEQLNSYAHADEFAGVQPAAKSPALTSVSAKPAALVPSVQHISAVTPERFTVQLLADFDLPQVKRFVARNNLQDRVKITRKSYQGKIIYTVTLGNFATYQAAEAEAKKFGKLLKIGHLWPRRFSSDEQQAMV